MLILSITYITKKSGNYADGTNTKSPLGHFKFRKEWNSAVEVEITLHLTEGSYNNDVNLEEVEQEWL